jgi:divalent metal cation (Fe/Co/Zn/Cd) transporter
VSADLHILVAPDTTVDQSHALAHDVEQALREKYPQLADVMVHVEPAGSAPETS